MQPLQPFWFQPKNAWWWLAGLLGLVFPLVVIVLMGLPLVVIDVPSALISVGLFVLLGIIGVFLLSRTRYAPDHGVVLLGVAFLVGAFVSIGLTFIFGFGIGNLTTLFGTPIFSASFGGAVPEETVKLLCVVILFNLTRRWVYHPAQVMVLGMGVGLGFDIIENMSYGANSAMLDPNSDLDALLVTWGLRMVAGPLAHMVWTGIAAYGFGQFIFNNKITGIGWLFFSMTIHFLFNTQWPFEVVLPKSLVDIAAFAAITFFYLLSLAVLAKFWIGAKEDFAQARTTHIALVEQYQHEVQAARAALAAMAQPVTPVMGQAAMPSQPPSTS